MKKIAFLAALSLLALLIVLPVITSINSPVSNPVLYNGTFCADGTPIPPLPPKKSSAATAKSSGTQLLIADGTPIPPLPPKKAS
jgi:hypothetical protein